MNNDEFTPISEILTRENLAIIYKFWHGKYNLLKTNKNKKDEMKLIYDYIKELIIRDKYLISQNRSIAAKKRAEDKRRAQEEESRKREEEEQLSRQKKIIFDCEFPAFNEELLDINNEIDILKTQLTKLEQKKDKLKTNFMRKCVHQFGSETSSRNGAYRWITCEICGFKEGTYECSL
jgi:hypothetical protein